MIVGLVLILIWAGTLVKSSIGRGDTWREYEARVLNPISPDEWKALAPHEQQAKIDELACYKRVMDSTRKC